MNHVVEGRLGLEYLIQMIRTDHFTQVEDSSRTLT